MIAVYLGMPGDCKTYSLVVWTYEMKKVGRPCISNFAIDGIDRLPKLSALYHPRYLGACVAIDEISQLLNAREYRTEDKVETTLFEIHRHFGLSIRYAAQYWEQVAKSLRELTEKVIMCYRCPPTTLDRAAEKKRLGLKISIWERPWFVKYVEYDGRDIQPDGSPKKDCERRVYYRRFKTRIANRYDTAERIATAGIQDEIDKRVAGEDERQPEQWVVQDGVSMGRRTLVIRARDEKRQREEQEKQARIARRAGHTFSDDEAQSAARTLEPDIPSEPEWETVAGIQGHANGSSPHA